MAIKGLNSPEKRIDVPERSREIENERMMSVKEEITNATNAGSSLGTNQVSYFSAD